MTGSALGYLRSKQGSVWWYRDFRYFLQEIASTEKNKERKKALKIKSVDWSNVRSFTNQVYNLIDEIRNIDKSMSDSGVVKSITCILPKRMQLDLALVKCGKLRFFSNYMRKYEIHLYNNQFTFERSQNGGRYSNQIKNDRCCQNNSGNNWQSRTYRKRSNYGYGNQDYNRNENCNQSRQLNLCESNIISRYQNNQQQPN